MPYPPNRVARDYESSHGVGRSSARPRLCGYHLTWVAVIVALLVAPATPAVASPSAVDQYTQHLPTANGGSAAGGGAGAATPVARPGLLSPKILAKLSGPDGRLLAQIATARDLGAPVSSGSGKGLGSSSRGFATVVAATFGAGPSLILLGGLAAVVAAGVWSRRRESAGRL